MTKAEMEYLDWGLIGPLCLFLNQYFNNFVSEYYVLWFALIWCTIDLMRYCGQVCLEICDHLRIELFRIPYPPRPSSSTEGTNQNILSQSSMIPQTSKTNLSSNITPSSNSLLSSTSHSGSVNGMNNSRRLMRSGKKSTNSQH